MDGMECNRPDPLCSHDAVTNDVWREYYEELASVDPGFAEEYRIYTGEIQVQQAGLTVSVQPLLRTVSCQYRYPDHAVEQYLLEYIADPGGDYLRLWRDVNGWRYSVAPGTVPFRLVQLVKFLEELPYAEPFLSLLADDRLRKLENALPVDALVAFTLFNHQDYPLVYLLVMSACPALLQHGNGRVITRESLARSLGVASLSNGQMTALRKLDLLRGMAFEQLAACQLIGREWPLLCKAVAHVSSLDARAILCLATLKRHGESLQHCRWVDHAMILRWLDPLQHHDHLLPFSACQHEPRFLVMWFALQAQGESPQRCRNERELAHRFTRCMADIVYSPGFNRRKQSRLTKKVLKALEPALHQRAAALLEGLLDDIRYNDDIASDCMADGTALVPVAGQPGHGFRQLATAGELRVMAKLLNNCAASRVWQGVTGESSFWRYDNSVTSEVALLQIYSDAFPEEDCIIEFNGINNAGISDQAKTDLREWLAGQGSRVSVVF